MTVPSFLSSPPAPTPPSPPSAEVRTSWLMEKTVGAQSFYLQVEATFFPFSFFCRRPGFSPTKASFLALLPVLWAFSGTWGFCLAPTLLTSPASSPQLPSFSSQYHTAGAGGVPLPLPCQPSPHPPKSALPRQTPRRKYPQALQPLWVPPRGISTFPSGLPAAFCLVVKGDFTDN